MIFGLEEDGSRTMNGIDDFMKSLFVYLRRWAAKDDPFWFDAGEEFGGDRTVVFRPRENEDI